MTYSFEPFATGGRASWSKDRKKITGTIAVRADMKVRLVAAEIVDGTFLVATFEVAEDSPVRSEAP